MKSVIGRFLEHHRVFYFYDSGNENVFIASADWMNRNFFKRVETCIPILNKKIKRRVVAEGLTIYMQDNVNSWLMNNDGSYERVNVIGKKICAQEYLMNKLRSTVVQETLVEHLQQPNNSKNIEHNNSPKILSSIRAKSNTKGK